MKITQMVICLLLLFLVIGCGSGSGDMITGGSTFDVPSSEGSASEGSDNPSGESVQEGQADASRSADASISNDQ